MSFSVRGTARLAFEGRSERAEAGEIPAALVDLARDMARLEPNLGHDERRALSALVLSALVAVEGGSTRVPLLGPHLRRAARLFGFEADQVEPIVRALATRDLETVTRDPEAYVPLILEEGHVYLQRMLLLECRFARSFHDRTEALVPVDRAAVRAAVAAVAGAPLSLSDEQRAAVEKAATQSLTVISGGPGTGKTSIVVALLRVLVRAGIAPEQIALAAPTGKAANRMDEAVRRSLAGMPSRDEHDATLFSRCPEAQTLHRMLGFSPKDSSFRHHEENRLQERVVIVDESSMIDLVLMERLLRCVRPDANLVLLGDAEQLPSVEAGAVLRDVRAADPEERFTVTLTRSYRMNEEDPAGRKILRAAGAINRAAPEELFAALSRAPTAPELTFEGVELLPVLGDGKVPRQALLERWYQERTKGHLDYLRLTRRHYRFAEGRFTEEDLRDLEALFDHQSRFSLLTITRERSLGTGARAVNESLHRMILKDLKQPATPFASGEPVMMQKNDYERGLFNGDQGVILSVMTDGRPHPMAVFRTSAGYEPFHLEALSKDLRLSHAITVHKSQGSELDHVAVILPQVEGPLLTRELLYTAVTRARRAVTIVGSENLLVSAVNRQVERFSGLADRLRHESLTP